jgi:quinolinate synthase
MTRLTLPVIAPNTLSAAEIATLQSEIKALAKQRNAVILAHNYQRPEVQDVADFVGDSLGLARKGSETDAEVIVFCGVHFMAETAAILSPAKRVLLPDLAAGCSLADQITGADVRKWRTRFPDYIAVGYVNTTAEVKAELDYCCTSGNVLDVIDAIPADKGILFLPDFFLGMHVKRNRPDRRVEVWLGECHVHRGINPDTLDRVRRENPEAEVLVHPECGCASQMVYYAGTGELSPDQLHIVSTEGMVRLAKSSPAKTLIVATETGILHRMEKMAPEKSFLAADPEAVCAYMKTITLSNVKEALVKDQFHVTVPAEIAERARLSVERMVALGAR